MQISTPHKSPIELQKTRDRLSGNTPPTAALAAAQGKETSPFMTPEQKAIAAANLKARMDARRSASPVGAAGITTPAGMKKGTRVSGPTPGSMQVSTPTAKLAAPAIAQASGPAPTTALAGSVAGDANAAQAHNVATLAAFNPQRHQTTGPRVFPTEQQGASTGKVIGADPPLHGIDPLLE
jgi:hypothetical protein